MPRRPANAARLASRRYESEHRLVLTSLSDVQRDAMRRLRSERCVPRRHLNAMGAGALNESVVKALVCRGLVLASKGFVELSEIGQLCADGLALRDVQLRLVRPMRADRTGGEAIAEVRHG